MGNKALSAKDAAKDKLGLQTCDTRTIKVDVTIDLIKEFGAEEVKVVVKDVQTDIGPATKVMSSERIRTFVEKAISEKASEIATRKAKAKSDEAMKQVGIA